MRAQSTASSALWASGPTPTWRVAGIAASTAYMAMAAQTGRQRRARQQGGEVPMLRAKEGNVARVA